MDALKTLSGSREGVILNEIIFTLRRGSGRRRRISVNVENARDGDKRFMNAVAGVIAAWCNYTKEA